MISTLLYFVDSILQTIESTHCDLLKHWLTWLIFGSLFNSKQVRGRLRIITMPKSRFRQLARFVSAVRFSVFSGYACVSSIVKMYVLHARFIFCISVYNMYVCM